MGLVGKAGYEARWANSVPEQNLVTYDIYAQKRVKPTTDKRYRKSVHKKFL